MVAAHAHVGSRVETGSSLANDNVAGDYALSAELLDAETLSGAVASVFTGSLSFLMGHILYPLNWLRIDGIDFDNGKLLAVAAATMVAFALLLFEDNHFPSSLVFKNGSGYFGAIDKG